MIKCVKRPPNPQKSIYDNISGQSSAIGSVDRSFGQKQMVMRALLYLFFLAGLGFLVFCAGLVRWPISKR
jgi:hypothetical protein